MKITQTKFTRNNMDRNEHETPSETIKLNYLQCWPFLFFPGSLNLNIPSSL